MSSGHGVRVKTQGSQYEEDDLGVEIEDDLGREMDLTQLRGRVEQLQLQLGLAREKEDKLRNTNQQLTHMVVSSSQAASKKTQQFVTTVEHIVTEKMQQRQRDHSINHIN